MQARIKWKTRSNPFVVNQLYAKVDPPYLGHSDIIVSQSNPMGMGLETFIFPSDASEEIIDFGNLDGSTRGDIDPDDLLQKLGYEVVETK